MDLSDLRIFLAVVREGDVTRAAERLNRVQSNVTTRIRQLEEDLDATLFIREGKRLQGSRCSAMPSVCSHLPRKLAPPCTILSPADCFDLARWKALRRSSCRRR
jgi:Bacterial regulatory helix-turn-helix protein, lysR family